MTEAIPQGRRGTSVSNVNFSTATLGGPSLDNRGFYVGVCGLSGVVVACRERLVGSHSRLGSEPERMSGNDKGRQGG